jgi:DNA-binding GntR family transcriptional regulator
MSGMDLQIIRKSATLRLLVEEKLRSAIAIGRFKPGQRLIERELCELTGVGRTSIREALRQLEAEGLVTTVPHRGPSVSTITLEEARQLYAVRALLEGHAGREFARRREPEDLRDLNLAVKRFVQAAKTDDRSELIQAKTAFYLALMRGCGNMFVEQMLTIMHNRITVLRLTSMTSPGRLKNSVAEIKAIHDAIRDGDADRAEALCINHIEEAAKVALRVLAAEDPPARTGH